MLCKVNKLLPSKSAIVRASFNILSYALAEKPILSITPLRNSFSTLPAILSYLGGIHLRVGEYAFIPEAFFLNLPCRSDTLCYLCAGFRLQVTHQYVAVNLEAVDLQVHAVEERT